MAWKPWTNNCEPRGNARCSQGAISDWWSSGISPDVSVRWCWCESPILHWGICHVTVEQRHYSCMSAILSWAVRTDPGEPLPSIYKQLNLSILLDTA